MPEKIIIIEKTDTETGEWSKKEYEGNYQIKMTNLNSLASYRLLRNGNIDIHKGERYLKYYFARIDILLEENLSYNELRLLLAIQSFATKMHTGEILHEDGSPVTTEELCKKAHVDISRGRTALGKLIKQQIIDRERRGRAFYYHANPFIFVAGKSITQEAFDRFKNSKWANMSISDELTNEKEKYYE